MPERLNVTVTPNGPLKLSHARSLKYCGEPLEVDGDVYLCRCGQTSSAPFCDGSHRTVGFDGSPEGREPKPIRVWEGRTVRTRFNPNTCMHAFYCKPLNDLRERELAGDDAAATEIMRVVGTCPSGALTWERKHPELEVPGSPEAEADVVIMEGGEVRLTCDFEINAPLPEHMHPERATLCRCGLSRNKPWCDGRHVKRDDFR